MKIDCQAGMKHKYALWRLLVITLIMSPNYMFPGFLSASSILLTAEGSPSQQQPPDPPFTVAAINERLQKSAKLYREEIDLAVSIKQSGIAFDPTAEVIKELREKGAHQHLINIIQRSARKDGSPAAQKLETTAAGNGDIFLDKARKTIAEYLDNMPDFICRQAVERYYDLGKFGRWSRLDTLNYDVAYNHGRESYAPISLLQFPMSKPLEKAGGSYSTGEFADGLAALFDPRTRASFKAAGTDRVENRVTRLYDFQVPVETSTLEIQPEGKEAIIAGYSGTIWIDEESLLVVRIDQAADDLTASVPVSSSESSVHYGRTKVTQLNREFLLPVRAEFYLSYWLGKHFFHNSIRFNAYRKFETGIRMLDAPPPVQKKT